MAPRYPQRKRLEVARIVKHITAVSTVSGSVGLCVTLRFVGRMPIFRTHSG